MHRDRAVCRNHVANAGESFTGNGCGDRNRARVDRGIDDRFELQQDRRDRLASRIPNPESRIPAATHAPRACSSFRWMPPNPPFDMITTMSPRRCSSTTVCTMSSTAGMQRARCFRARKSSTSCSADSRSDSGRDDRRPPRRPLRRPRRTIGRSHPGTRAGKTRRSAARRPPRCGDPGNLSAAPTVFRVPPSDGARNHPSPSRPPRCPPPRAAA